MEISDDDLMQELKKRFLDTKKALHDMRVMNAKIEKLNVKLAESERLKTNFLSNIRNEINNPLTSILAMAQNLTAPGRDEERAQVMARTIYQEAFDLDFQLRNIFAAAEIEAGETTLSPARVEVAKLVQKAIDSFSDKAQEKKVSVLFTPESIQFGTDPEKLRLIVANLLSNAIEYNQEGKTVRVEARRENGVLRLSIADEGAGIPESERERLFERFRQLEQGSSKAHRGHGLGLSITKALVDLLGGKISLAAAPRGGSVATVELPEVAGGDVLSEDGNEFLFEGGRAF